MLNKYKCFPRSMNLVPWEMDFFYITTSGYGHEIEIKNNISDLRRDFSGKVCKHMFLKNGLPKSNKYVSLDPSTLQNIPKSEWVHPQKIPITTFSYLIEPHLVPTALAEVPENYGIYLMSANGFITQLRKGTILPHYRKPTDSEVLRLLESTHNRYWDFFEKHAH